MKRAFSALAFCITLTVLHGAALAKAPAVKIVIEGGGLTKGIEITDPKALQLSNPWFGHFLDSTHGAVSENPRGMGPYEISIYVEFAKNDVRKAYVMFYHPNAEGQPGYIYLPGKGDVWQMLNWGTIIREGQDGKWSYADREWEDLIKPIVIRTDSCTWCSGTNR